MQAAKQDSGHARRRSEVRGAPTFVKRLDCGRVVLDRLRGPTAPLHSPDGGPSRLPGVAPRRHAALDVTEARQEPLPLSG